jgi:asparagine synthase (glutamine-hydrolysing)
MCGICGIYFTEGTPPEGRHEIEALTRTIRHRGPDDSGYHVDGRVALGFRRLSIIDVSGGHQPIYNEDRTVSVIFNGEIYNFHDIRSRLIADGHVFRTNSDTETIVHAYEAWGDQCVERFRGMFAFALRDERNDRLLLARDRFGKKPVFYAQYGGKFVFASEMKAILADPAFDRRLDQEALASYFMLSYIPAPLTIFRGIRKLLPGHVLTIEGGRLRERRYWGLSFRPDRRRREADVIEELNARLADAVRIRLMSEVPLGAFLSGGIDSSAVVAYMARASETPVNTFTIGFTGDTGSFDDERKYAAMVAERYRTNHREMAVRPHVADVMEAIVGSFDEPFADDSMVPSYFVCKLAREHVTVALTGLGGDEAFCGYERYLGFHLSQYFNRLPGWFRSGAVLPLVNSLGEPRGGGTRINHLKRFVRSSGEEEARRYLGFVLKIGPAYQDSLFAAASGIGPETMAAVERRFMAHYDGADAEDSLDRVFSCDVHTYLADDILALTDRLSMCHSLEVRVPFLDHELFEFCATIPSEMKLKWFRKKYLLKKALRHVVPEPILSHRKQGFVGPMAQWLRGDLRSYTEQVLSRRELARHGLLDQTTVGRILDDHLAGRETNDTLIWSLVVFQVWYNLYMDNSVREPVAADVTY